MIHLENGTKIGDYTVERFIKDGPFNSSYQAVGGDGKHFFMKVFDLEAVPPRLRSGDTVLEILNSRGIEHPHVISYVADTTAELGGRQCAVLIMQYFQGRLLSEVLREGRVFTGSEARELIVPVLRGLVYLESKCSLNHNDITPRNILLEDGPDGRSIPKIIDLGHTHASISSSPPFPVEDLNLAYSAPETLDGAFTPESDAFSLAAVLFNMVCGRVPWNISINEENPYQERRASVIEARRREPIWPAAIHSLDTVMKNIILTGLRINPAHRISPTEMLDLLSEKPASDERQRSWTEGKKSSPEGITAVTDGTVMTKTLQRSRGKGGFADVAGMESLKKMLLERVVWVLRDRARARKYRLVPPNGMLLYGPPGCGKTYFAEKFAEESGFNYMVVNGSDLGSTYIHGTQGKIAALFKEAASNSPTVLCFDEFDSFVPSRSSESARHRPDEVNEFLSQLNNCADKGIFVIGTTNRMDMIDPAVLRKGRLDLLVEVPAPEMETRLQMFRHHLRSRPLADDIDLERLAGLTEGYAASDIAFIANDAALVAALADENISQRHLEDSIRCNPSSLGAKSSRNPIGYR